MVDGLYNEVTARLKLAGFVFHRQGKGSHEFWMHPDTGKKILIARSLKGRGLANRILKQAGLPKLP
ncbi:MAG: type II toxin-antitoxin system HicA family toxin [Pseudomonadota bacterium]